jgi:hypothetical protein
MGRVDSSVPVTRLSISRVYPSFSFRYYSHPQYKEIAADGTELMRRFCLRRLGQNGSGVPGFFRIGSEKMSISDQQGQIAALYHIKITCYSAKNRMFLLVNDMAPALGACRGINLVGTCCEITPIGVYATVTQQGRSPRP